MAEFRETDFSPLEVPLGRDISNGLVTADLAKMPHLLIAGSTGSGKSVAINVILTSLLMNCLPEQVKLVLIDPKKVELGMYHDLPHLLTPVVTEPRKAAVTLEKVVAKMQQRYEIFAQTGQRNLTGYNKMAAKDPANYEQMPYIVVVVDELADLMMTTGNEVEAAITRIAQMGRAAGIHLILDGVFSHVGRNSKYFNFNGNYGKHAGAARDKNSEYYPWFSFERYPDKYRCWWGNADLPVVDKNNPQFQQFIYGEKNSVLAKWNQLGVDGWRLDVADELPDPFIAKIRKNLDGYRERLLLGEVWEDASNKVAYSQRRHYVKGDELDGVMNYPLREAILDLLAQKRSAETIAKEMMKLRENYPLDFYLNSLNNIGTHDTKRILTALGGDVTKVKRAFELLFMFPGVPCIYYGDEVGLPGGTDPDNRRFYPWGREDHGLLEHVRSLTAKRQAEPALIKGELTLLAGEGFFGVGRYQAGRKVVYLLNASEKPNEFYADKLQQFHDEWNLRAMMTKANGKEFGPFESITLTSDNC